MKGVHIEKHINASEKRELRMDYSYEYTPLRPGGTPLTRQLLLLGGEMKNHRVLDLGCGRGETAGLLAREYGAAVTGVDASEALIRACRAQVPEAEFLTADAENLPFEDSSFDILISECCFSVFSDPKKALREAKRVLVSGGKLLISDLWICAGSDGGRPVSGDSGLSAAGDGGRSVSGDGGRSAAGDGMVRHLYTKETWLRMIIGAGFTPSQFIDVRRALTQMYVQMIFDLGLKGAREKMGICLPPEEMKNISYMLLAAS